MLSRIARDFEGQPNGAQAIRFLDLRPRQGPCWLVTVMRLHGDRLDGNASSGPAQTKPCSSLKGLRECPTPETHKRIGGPLETAGGQVCCWSALSAPDVEPRVMIRHCAVHTPCT